MLWHEIQQDASPSTAAHWVVDDFVSRALHRPSAGWRCCFDRREVSTESETERNTRRSTLYSTLIDTHIGQPALYRLPVRLSGWQTSFGPTHEGLQWASCNMTEMVQTYLSSAVNPEEW